MQHSTWDIPKTKWDSYHHDIIKNVILEFYSFTERFLKSSLAQKQSEYRPVRIKFQELTHFFSERHQTCLSKPEFADCVQIQTFSHMIKWCISY